MRNSKKTRAEVQWGKKNIPSSGEKGGAEQGNLSVIQGDNSEGSKGYETGKTEKEEQTGK